MRIVILGCGRLGTIIAGRMIKDPKNQVNIIDKDRNALMKLGDDFPGKIMQADGVNMAIYSLILNETEKTDVFLALTNIDNTNIMAAEIAKQKYKVDKVIARIDDPIRAKAFEELGIETFCPTTLSEKRIIKMMTPAKTEEDKGE
ncbi:MAG: TrkA family potassium uptake protein [Candidatus Goldbacteria bacterium]|nr:TrkA family potassium uptake protein [Candidatus Goldiibacteriota bacterium]